MPRVDEAPADDSVTAVLRALSLLDAFRLDDDRLSLATLSRRANVPKTTVLRLARTLRSAGYWCSSTTAPGGSGRPPHGWRRATRPGSTCRT